MSSPSSAAELLNAGLFEGGSPDFLSPVQSEVTSGDAESVSPRSSAGSEQSLTTQLLLGHRSNLFSKTSMSASSPSASLSASPVHGSSKGQKFNEQPGADEVSDFPHSIPGPAYAAPAVNSSSTLKHPPGHHKCDGLLPDLHQQFTSNAVPDPNSSPSGQVHPADTSVQPARKSTSPVEASSLLSIPSQLSSIRTPTPASSACPEVTSTAGSIHSSSTDRLMNASQASMLDPSSVPQLVSLHSANAIPHVEGSKAASSNGSAAPTFAQPEPGDSSDADVTDPSSLQEDQDIQFDLVSEPASRSSDAGLVSEPTSRLAGDDLVSEPASRSVDVDLVSRPANRSVEAVLVSAPASSPTGTKLPNAGNQNPRHDPHVTPDTGAPSPHESTSAELPSIALPQSTLSAEAGSLETSEAAVGTDTGLEAGIPDTDSPQAEPLEADPGTDAVLGPSTASRDSPQAEQLDAAAGMDAVPRPSTASSDTPQAEQSAANAGTDAVPGPSTACFNNPQAEQPEADAGLAAVNRPSMASCDSPQAEHPEAGIDALPGPSMTRCDSAHIERQSSSAAASTSGTEEPAPQTHRDAHRLDAQKDGQGGVTHAWKQHPKHVLILSNAGKPIWTLHGDENALAGLTAVIQALVSFVHDKGDSMKSIRAGKHLIVFLEKGPFILVMASSTKEPESALLGQLGLVHAQILSILTTSVEKMFARNPSYDVRKLLGATNHVLTTLVTSFDRDPSALLTSLVPLPLRSSLRHYALLCLQGAVKSAGALFGVLLTQTAIVAVAQSRAHVMHPHDLLLLANLVRSNESFRQAETFTPVCLPHFNPTAFLHAYVQYLHVASGFCLVLLSPQQESFFKLAEAAQEVHRQLKQPGVSQAVISTVENQAGDGLLSITNLPTPCGGGEAGTTPLLHFLYKSPMRAQVIMPAFAPPLDTPGLQQAAMQRYATVHAAMFPGGSVSYNQRSLSTIPSSQSLPAPSLQQQVHWCADGSLATLAYAGPEYELYALFDTMTEKVVATQICHRLSVWIKGQQADLFMQR